MAAAPRGGSSTSIRATSGLRAGRDEASDAASVRRGAGMLRRARADRAPLQRGTQRPLRRARRGQRPRQRGPRQPQVCHRALRRQPEARRGARAQRLWRGDGRSRRVPRPEGISWARARKHALRSILDRLLVVVHAAAKRLALGASARTSFAAKAIAKRSSSPPSSPTRRWPPTRCSRSSAAGARDVRAAYGVYLLASRQIWAPRAGDAECTGLAYPPADRPGSTRSPTPWRARTGSWRSSDRPRHSTALLHANKPARALRRECRADARSAILALARRRARRWCRPCARRISSPARTRTRRSA